MLKRQTTIYISQEWNLSKPKFKKTIQGNEGTWGLGEVTVLKGRVYKCPKTE